jgi:hypothetical protein
MASTHHSRVGARKRIKLKKWSGKVTRESHALSLENGVFKKPSAHDIAASMLTFYINRAGKSLSASRKRTLETAKDELRKLFA